MTHIHEVAFVAEYLSLIIFFCKFIRLPV